MREILVPWNSQPQEAVRPAQRWLDRGLVYADPLVNPYDALTGQLDTVVGTRQRAVPWGLGRGFGGTLGGGATDSIQTRLTAHGVRRTYIIRAQLGGSYGGNGLGRLFDKRVAGAQVELFYAQDDLSKNQLVYGREFTGGTNQWTSPVNSVLLNTAYVFAAAYDSSSSANNPRLFIDGASQTLTKTVSATGTAVSNADAYVVGNRKNDNSRGFDGVLSDFYVFNEVLTDEEIRELSANPGALWEDQSTYTPRATGIVTPSLQALPRIDAARRQDRYIWTP